MAAVFAHASATVGCCGDDGRAFAAGTTLAALAALAAGAARVRACRKKCRIIQSCDTPTDVHTQRRERAASDDGRGGEQGGLALTRVSMSFVVTPYIVPAPAPAPVLYRY